MPSVGVSGLWNSAVTIPEIFSGQPEIDIESFRFAAAWRISYPFPVVLKYYSSIMK
jgi:hypothetical protein